MNGWVYLDGDIIDAFDERVTSLAELPYVWRQFRTLSRKPLCWEANCTELKSAAKAVFGYNLHLDSTIAESVSEMLRRNHYPMCGVLVEMRCVADLDKFHILLFCGKVLLDETWAVSAVRRTAEIIPYRIPFEEYYTSASREMFKLLGRERLPIVETSGVVHSVCGMPLCAVRDRKIIALTPWWSVENELVHRAAAKVGFEYETAVSKVSDFHSFDELFAVTPEGITSIGECSGVHFMSLYVRKIIEGFKSF